jgi:hypothetical protein
VPDFEVVFPESNEFDVVSESQVVEYDVVPEDITLVDVTIGTPGPTGPASTVPGPQGVKGDTGPMPGDGSITAFVALTQAAYDALGTKNATTVYVITP